MSELRLRNGNTVRFVETGAAQFESAGADLIVYDVCDHCSCCCEDGYPCCYCGEDYEEDE